MSSNLIKAIQSQAISWAGHITFMEKWEMRRKCYYEIIVGASSVLIQICLFSQLRPIPTTATYILRPCGTFGYLPRRRILYKHWPLPPPPPARKCETIRSTFTDVVGTHLFCCLLAVRLNAVFVRSAKYNSRGNSMTDITWHLAECAVIAAFLGHSRCGKVALEYAFDFTRRFG